MFPSCKRCQNLRAKGGRLPPAITFAPAKGLSIQLEGLSPYASQPRFFAWNVSKSAGPKFASVAFVTITSGPENSGRKA